MASVCEPISLERRFTAEIRDLVATARRACLRLLPWAPDEHDSIVQEALERTLVKVRAGQIADGADLAGYVYGIARNCVREARRRAYRAELRACALPEDDEVLATLYGDTRGLSVGSPAPIGEDVTQARLLAGLRYYVVHMCARATVAKRRQALRDTFILAQHYLRGVSLVDIAHQLGITRRACQYAIDRARRDLARVFDPESRDVRSFVDNSELFAGVSELTDFLSRQRAA